MPGTAEEQPSSFLAYISPVPCLAWESLQGPKTVIPPDSPPEQHLLEWVRTLASPPKMEAVRTVAGWPEVVPKATLTLPWTGWSWTSQGRGGCQSLDTVTSEGSSAPGPPESLTVTTKATVKVHVSELRPWHLGRFWWTKSRLLLFNH